MLIRTILLFFVIIPTILFIRSIGNAKTIIEVNRIIAAILLIIYVLLYLELIVGPLEW